MYYNNFLRNCINCRAYFSAAYQELLLGVVLLQEVVQLSGHQLLVEVVVVQTLDTAGGNEVHFRELVGRFLQQAEVHRLVTGTQQGDEGVVIVDLLLQ